MKGVNIAIGVIVLLLVGGGAWYLSRKPVVAPAPQVNERPAPQAEAGQATVKITAEGYSPAALAVKAGTRVTFVNEDSNPHWIASAAHPTHTVYPGSDIKKCGTSDQGGIFDACKGLAKGESFSFTFNEKGSWNYHDHLNVRPPFFGSITVE